MKKYKLQVRFLGELNGREPEVFFYCEFQVANEDELELFKKDIEQIIGNSKYNLVPNTGRPYEMIVHPV